MRGAQRLHVAGDPRERFLADLAQHAWRQIQSKQRSRSTFLGELPQVGFRNNYQIYYFNGCSTYAYFNSMYFTAKPGGKKNLEIITSGLPTLSSSAVANILSDYFHAVRDGALLPNLGSIPAFRIAQFWGTYQGFAQRGEAELVSALAEVAPAVGELVGRWCRQVQVLTFPSCATYSHHQKL